MKRVKSLSGLFCTGYIQVVLVTVNMWQIANDKYVSALPVAFCIAFFWTLSVKHVAFGKLPERLVYSCGAMTGCLCGMLLARGVYA